MLGWCVAGLLVHCGRADDASESVVVLQPAAITAFSEQLRTNHPALRAAASRLAASTHAARGVRRFADPVFQVSGAVRNESRMSSVDEGNLAYGLQQNLPVMGKESAARQRAEATQATDETRAEARFQELRRDLALALFQAALAERAAELQQQDLDWHAQAISAAEARYRGGLGASSEVLRLRGEHARLQTEVTAARLQLEAARAAVNRALGVPPETPLPVLALPEVGDPVPFSTNLVRLAARYEPGIQVRQRERAEAEAAREVTRRSRRPDLALGIQGSQYGGDGGMREGLFTLSLSLPWFNRDRYRRDLQRDDALLQAVEEDLADLRLGVHNEIFQLTRRIAAARQEAVGFRDQVIPATDAALASVHAAWGNGRAMLTDVLDARRALVEARLMLARAIAGQWSAMAELVLCCGVGDLESLQMLGHEFTAEPAEPELP